MVPEASGERRNARKRKRPAEAGRLCQLRIGVARLVERLFGISIVLARSLALLARFRAAALLLTGLDPALDSAGRVGSGLSYCFLSWEHHNNGSESAPFR